MRISNLIFDLSFIKHRNFQEISIELIRHEQSIDHFLGIDHASQLTLERGSYKIFPDVLYNPKTPITESFKVNIRNKRC